MSDLVTIGGVRVSIDAPCDVLRELRKAELVIATGGSVSMTRFGEDEVRFSETNRAGLASLIARYQGLCDAAQGRRMRRARPISWS